MATMPVESVSLEQLPKQEGSKKGWGKFVAFYSSNSEVVAWIPAQKTLGKGGPVSIHKASSSRWCLQGISSERLGTEEICWLSPPAGSPLALGPENPCGTSAARCEPRAGQTLPPTLPPDFNPAAEPRAAPQPLSSCSKPSPWCKQASSGGTRMVTSHHLPLQKPRTSP